MAQSKLIRGYEVVIGLETHAQLSTQSKIFSGSPTAFGAAPNTQASPVDLALPGTLPVMNRGAVERAIRFGLAVGAKVVNHGRYVAFQMAEVAIPRNLFADILRLIAELRPPPVTSTA